MLVIFLSVSASIRQNKSRKTNSNRANKMEFQVFRYNLGCRPSI
jgi:hypothetical protein